jgi:hypothetical protein
MERSNGLCEITGKWPIQIHHIIYRSHGGKNDRRNMIALWVGLHPDVVHKDEKYWTPVLLEKMHEYYGDFDISELKKQNKWNKLGSD